MKNGEKRKFYKELLHTKKFWEKRSTKTQKRKRRINKKDGIEKKRIVDAKEIGQVKQDL